MNTVSCLDKDATLLQFVDKADASRETSTTTFADKLAVVARLLNQATYRIQKTQQGWPKGYFDPCSVLESSPATAAFGDLFEVIFTQKAIPEVLYGDLIRVIDYTDGHPLVDGRYFWEKLPGEPFALFEAFQSYVALNNTGDGQRSLRRLSERSSADLTSLSAACDLWCWRLRAEAYDRYESERVEGHKERLVLQMCDSHYKESKSLREKISELIQDKITTDPDSIEARDLFKFYELAIKTERLSLGLPGDKVDQRIVHEGNPDKPIEIRTTWGENNAVMRAEREASEGGKAIECSE